MSEGKFSDIGAQMKNNRPAKITLNNLLNKTTQEKKTITKRKAKSHFITKTCLYNFDPLKPHFYIVKLGFTGVYIIFLISAQKHRLWYSLEPPRRGGSNEYLQSKF